MNDVSLQQARENMRRLREEHGELLRKREYYDKLASLRAEQWFYWYEMVQHLEIGAPRPAEEASQ